MLSLVIPILVGCGGTPMEQMLPVTRSREALRTQDTLGLSFVVPRPVAAVWQALPAVLTDLGLEINFREPAAKRVGTCFQRVRGRLGKTPLSRYVDCGEVVSRPNADVYQIDLTAIATLQADSGGTRLSTFVLAVGQRDTSGERVWCRTKGELEDRIKELVLAKAP